MLAGDVVAVQIVRPPAPAGVAAIDGAAGERLADVVVVLPDRVDQVLARADAVRRRRGAAPRARSSRSCRPRSRCRFPRTGSGPRRPPTACPSCGRTPCARRCAGRRPRFPGRRPCLADEGVVLGNGVVLALVLVVDVDAQHLAEERLQVLAVVERVVGRAAVAERDVEVAVGAEAEGAAVVVPERLA